MKKSTERSPSKATHKKAVKNLDVKPVKGGSVRGGFSKINFDPTKRDKTDEY
jgi:hypothetical protein